MTVAADHNCKSRSLGLEIQLCQIVKDVDRDAIRFENVSFRETARPASLVDIAAHGGDGSNRRKLLNDLGRTHIPGMNNVIRPAQSFDCLRTQQTVSIRYDADQDREFSR